MRRLPPVLSKTCTSLNHKGRYGVVPCLGQEILHKYTRRHREIAAVDCGFWAERKYGENQEVKVVFTNNSLGVKPE